MAKTLAIDRVAERIKSSVFENRVTLVIGKTGCGKSSRVPQMLQEELGAPIICTQPRRLAAVSIARHVANLVGSPLGRDVGFRIGQRAVASAKTKILFTTAGLLLEELRAQGPAALRRYTCLVVDELHERSVESDLLLAVIHAMVAPTMAPAGGGGGGGGSAAAGGAMVGSGGGAELPSLKLVLMSATANVERYKHYFKLPGDHVALIQCDVAERAAAAIGEWLETIKVVYLDSVVSKVLAGHPNAGQHAALLAQHKAGGVTPLAQVEGGMQALIRDLVLQLDRQERDPDGVILVFLPTYRALELQHRLLSEAPAVRSSDQDLEIVALHSSVDIDEALRSMGGGGNGGGGGGDGGGCGRRKVILSTNVAESSVTIPNVKHVIDGCTMNQIYWDADACRERAEVVWASQSAAQQRAGRTGRTCPGTCYRLLLKPAFFKLEKFEASALMLRSLRRETLSLLSASSRSMCDPSALLAQALDPPPPGTVDAALEYLQQIGAAAPGGRGRAEATPTGAFLASLPLSLEASLLLARGGAEGLLWEAAVLAALMNTTPYPIRQPFGSDPFRHVRRYLSGSGGGGHDDDGGGGYGGGYGAARPGSAPPLAGGVGAALYGPLHGARPGAASLSAPSLGALEAGGGGGGGGGVPRAAQLVANLAAVEAWQLHWCDARRLARMLDSSLGEEEEEGDGGDEERGGSEGGGGGRRAGGGASAEAEGALRALTGVSFDELESGGAGGGRCAAAQEEEWCRRHHLVAPSLRHVAETAAAALAAVFKHRPAFVRRAGGAPEYYTRGARHRCALLPGGAAGGGGAADGGAVCGCEGLRAGDLHSPSQQRRLTQLLNQVFEGGTAEADALLLSAVPSSHPGYGPGDAGDAAGDADDSYDFDADESVPICKFYLSSGHCSRGPFCQFRHKRPACRFYFGKGGCAYGARCRFLHAAAAGRGGGGGGGAGGGGGGGGGGGLEFDWGRPEAGAGAYEAELIEGRGGGGGGGGGLADHIGGGGKRRRVLVVGEGDFSFAAALLSRRAKRAIGGGGGDIITAGGDVIASSFESAAQLRVIYPGRALQERLGFLEAAGVEIRYSLDATQLHEALPRLLAPAGAEGAAVAAAAGRAACVLSHVVWNFPLASSAEVPGDYSSSSAAAAANKMASEDDGANRALVGAFFEAAAGLAAAWNPDLKVHVALCNDQYGRWGVHDLARRCFLFLERSVPLHLQDWPGYVPRRGQLDGSFPCERPVVYTFGLRLPPALLGAPGPLHARLEAHLRAAHAARAAARARRAAAREAAAAEAAAAEAAAAAAAPAARAAGGGRGSLRGLGAGLAAAAAGGVKFTVGAADGGQGAAAGARRSARLASKAGKR